MLRRNICDGVFGDINGGNELERCQDFTFSSVGIADSVPGDGRGLCGQSNHWNVESSELGVLLDGIVVPHINIDIWSKKVLNLFTHVY